ncbi:MAG: hypothetical protein KJZ53_01915 [Anaerolineales bacterium]|nr:hypothetical protein [Anaerolineales bacterium]MCL4257267.1 hypothetical protein [Anaerolineales bacterium]
MEENNKPEILVERDQRGTPSGLGTQFKLLLRLMRDPRVSPLLKVLPVGAVVYLFSPDLIPMILDDAVVLGVGFYAFIELCPPDVVAEHRAALAAEAARGS